MRKRWSAVAAAAAVIVTLLVLAPAGSARTDAEQAALTSLSLPASWRSSCRLPLGQPPAPARSVAVRRGVAYLPGLRLDVYLPRNARADRPGVLALHGGGWRYGDRSGMAWTARRLAQAGFVVVVPDYTLSGPGRPTYPLAVDEVQAAVRFMRRNAGSFNLDPRRLGVLGSSAGGNLALRLADGGVGRCDRGSRVAAVVTWSAPTELAALGACSPSGCTLRGLAEGYLGCSLRTCPALWRAASPLSHVSADDPPTLLFTSEEEFVPARQATAMARKLQAVSVPQLVVRFGGHRHASDYRGDAIAGSARFLALVLSGGAR